MSDQMGYADGAELEELAAAATEYVARMRSVCQRVYGAEVWDAMPAGDRGGALVSMAVQPLLQGFAHEDGVQASDAFQGLGLGIAAILQPLGDKARQAALTAMGRGIHRSATSVANMTPKGRG